MKFIINNEQKINLGKWVGSSAVLQFAVFFVLIISYLVISTNLLFPKQTINQSSLIKYISVKQTSAIVASQSVKWTVLVKRNSIKSGQYLIQLPKTAKSIKIKIISKEQAQNIVSNKPQNQLSLNDKKNFANLSSKNIFTRVIAFLFAGLEQAAEQAIEQVVEQFSEEIITTDEAKFVDVSEYIIEQPTEQPAEVVPPVEIPAGVLPLQEIYPESVEELPVESVELLETEQPAEVVPPVEIPAGVLPLQEIYPESVEELPVESVELLETVSSSGQEAIIIEETEIIEEEIEEEYVEIDYKTPAPQITEQKTDTGKLVTVSAPDEFDKEEVISTTPIYIDVLAFTNIPEIFKVGQEDKIKIKWKNNGNQDVTFNAYDTDNNGKLDYVEWTISHLSEQTFEIIFISKAFRLDSDKNIIEDIYDAVKTQDNNWASINDSQYIRVTFNSILSDANDNTIYAKPTDINNPATIEVYPVYIDQDGNWTEGPLVATFENIDHEDIYKVLLTNLQTPTDVFDLKIISNVDIDYIVDPTCTSTGTGNWNTIGTWSCGWVPTGSDDVVIQTAHIVTMDLSSGAVANSLSITGTLAFGANAYTLTVGTSGVTVNTGGNITGTVASIITTSGNITVNSTTITSTTVKFTMTGAATTISGSGTIPLPVVLAASQTASISSGTLTISGIISGATYSLTKIGAGTLTLSGANTFDNGVNLEDGTLNINHNSALGTGTFQIGATTGSTAVTFNVNAVRTITNVLRIYQNFTFTGTNTLSQGTGTITICTTATATVSASVITLGGVIDDGVESYGITKAGTGTLVFSAANTYAGTTTVSAGVLRLSNATALPGGIEATGGTSALTISGGVVELANGNFARGLGTGVDQVQFTASGGFSSSGADRTVNLGGASAGVVWNSGSFVPTGSILILSSAVGSNKVTFQNPIDFVGVARTIQIDNGTGTDDAAISAIISDTGSSGLTKTGAGTLVLSGANTYTGLNTLNAGTVSISAENNLGVVANDVTFGGGTLQVTAGFTANSDKVFAVGTSTGTLNINSSQILIFRTDGNLTAGSAGTLIKSGTGTATISVANTGFDGTFRIDAGILILSDSDSAVGDTSTRATLRLNGGTVTINDNTARAFSANLTVAANSTAISNRSSSGAGVTHSFNSTSLGAFTLSVNGGGNVTSGTAQLTLGALTLTGNGTINSTNPAGGGTTNSSITTVGGNTYSLTIGGTGNTDITGAITTTTGTLAKAGAGTLTLTGSFSNTGSITITAGTFNANAIITTSGTLKVLGSSSLINLNAAVTIATANFADFSTGLGTVNASTNALIITSNMILKEGVVVTLTGGTSFTVSGSNIADSSVARTITLSGGTLTATGGGFKYYQFTPTKLRSEATANSVQMSELQFFLVDGWTAATEVTNPGGNNPAAETPPKANDNSTATKWLDFNKHLPLVYDFGSPRSFDEYNWATANDAIERDPIRWKVEGSSDNINWIMIDDRTGADQTVTNTRLTWVASGATRYSGYALGSSGTSTIVNMPQTNIIVTASSTLSLGSATDDHTLGNLSLVAAGGGNPLTISTANSITFSGIASTGTGTASITGTPVINIASGQNVSVANGVNLTVSSVIGGTSALTKIDTGILTLSGANTFSGGLTIKAGTAQGSTSASAFGGSGTGAITLGNTTGTDSATLLVSTTSLTFANPITLATNATVGTLTIGNTGTEISTTFSGGVTGTNNFTINSNATTGIIEFSTATLNNIGTITHIGAGSGIATISSVIGSNMTGITQNSATSALMLSGNNSTVGSVTISTGTFALSGTTNLNVGGGWTNSVGAGGFTANTSTVTLTTGTHAITGANTFYNLTLNANNAVTFPASTTQTIGNTFSCIGTVGNVITIDSSSPATQATLSAVAGTFNCDYLSLTDSDATGGAVWHAGANSTAVSNVTGWLDFETNTLPVASSISIDSGATSVILIGGTTKNVVCSGTVTDADGYADITSITAKFYRSGVGAGAGDDNANHYTLTGDGNCIPSGGSENTETYTCTFPVYFYAEPTDAGSDYAAENWVCQMTPSDNVGAGTADTDTIEMGTLQSISVSETINFGSISPGADSSGDHTTTVTNNGNVAIDFKVSGGGLNCSTRGTIPVANQEYGLSSFSYGNGDDLSGSAADVNADLPKPTSITPSVIDYTYWQTSVPIGSEGTCTGTTTFVVRSAL